MIDSENNIPQSTEEALERVNEEIRQYLKPTIQSQFQEMYQNVDSEKITPIIDEFTELVVNPNCPEDEDLEEGETCVKFQEFSNNLQVIHDDLELSEDEITNNLTALNEFYDTMQEQMEIFCQQQAVSHMNEFMGESFEPNHEVLGISFGFKDQETGEWFEKDIDLTKDKERKKGMH